MRCRTRRIPAILAGCLPALLALQAPAADSGSFFGEISEARELHDRGVEGDKQAVVECIATLERMLAEHPGNQLARVYLGSAYTLRSRDLFIGLEKLAKLREGGRLMDAAVAAAPRDIRVRFVRAINYYKLPAILGKRQLARDELIALARMLRDGGGGGLDALERQGVLFYAGLALRDRHRDHEAATAWRRAVALAPGSRLAPRIERELAGL